MAARAETPLALTRRARRTNKELAALYPHAHCELDFTTPLELLVATILSAQTTDVTVNKVTPTLFAKYPDAIAYAEADREEMEAILKPTGFFRAKTNSRSPESPSWNSTWPRRSRLSVIEEASASAASSSS